MNRAKVCAAVAKYYTEVLKGKVWCVFDTSKRKYEIRGEGLPAHRDLAANYPNGWSMMDHLTPKDARAIAAGKPTRPEALHATDGTEWVRI